MTEGKWIPIDRPPTSERPVLAVGRFGTYFIARCVRNEHGEPYWIDDADAAVLLPTHWRGLPRPPKQSAGHVPESRE